MTQLTLEALAARVEALERKVAELAPAVRPGTGDWDAFAKAAAALRATYDFDATLAAPRAGGVTIPFVDAVIATVAIVNDVELWTRDAHFTLVQSVLPALKLFAEPP